MTWGLLGFNVLLFVVVQLWLEPWKRRRLVGGFEEKVREVIQEEGLRAALLNMRVEPKTAAASAMGLVAEEVDGALTEVLTAPGTMDVVNSEPVLLEDDILHTPAGVDEALVEGLAAVGVAVEVEGRQNRWHTRSGLGVVGKWLSFVGGQVDDAFSDQVIHIKKYEFTKALLEGIGLGAFLFALVSQILRSF